MTQIAQLFESALRQNVRKAAMNTVARMPPSTTLSELLNSDAGEAVRELTLRDLKEALREAGLAPKAAANNDGRRRPVNGDDQEWSESREERLYRRILDAMADEPLTIGQLSKRIDVDVDELRGYLNWMKKMGKVQSSGRARATRYQAVP